MSVLLHTKNEEELEDGSMVNIFLSFNAFSLGNERRRRHGSTEYPVLFAFRHESVRDYEISGRGNRELQNQQKPSSFFSIVWPNRQPANFSILLTPLCAPLYITTHQTARFIPSSSTSYSVHIDENR